MTTIKINYKKEKSIDVDYLANAFIPINIIHTSNNPTNITYNPFHLCDIQNYNPIYSRFFELTENNYNKVTLNQKYGIRETQLIERDTGEVKETAIFFKFAPLLDPIRYMIGKYDLTDPTLKVLPSIITSITCFPKIADPNNVSYIDAFFSYLGSQLLHNHNVFHAVDFYGSYVGIQELFKTNVTDEMEYLHSSDFFGKHLNTEFYVENSAFHEYMNYGSRNNRPRIQISKGSRASRISIGAEELAFQEPDKINEREPNSSELRSSVLRFPEFPRIPSATRPEYFTNSACNKIDDQPISAFPCLDTEEVVYEKVNGHNKTNISTTSIASSQDSGEFNYSSDEDEEKATDTQNQNVTNSDDNCDSDTDETETEHSGSEPQEEEEIYAFIKNFPTQMICLEKCDGTLDELFMHDKIDVSQSASCLFQIIMALIVFQKAFSFTHNDLHTNNIMYMNTDIEYLYYCYETKYYRVPTYGRIFKIIDFGRSIYRFQGKTFCSDSFESCGDAYSQYNCEPYINNKKPRVDPNYSFDLCRLGCSIYDFIMDEFDTTENELQETITRWCTDDNGKNILYKRSGEERYPGFKLYKMIARNVHKHTPHAQLKFPFFNQFEVSSKKMKKINVETIRKYGIHIDEIPSYVA
jgi:hypothetical protein